MLESRIEAIRQEGYRIGPDYRNGEKTVCAVLELFDLNKWGDTLNFRVPVVGLMPTTDPGFDGPVSMTKMVPSGCTSMF